MCKNNWDGIDAGTVELRASVAAHAMWMTWTLNNPVTCGSVTRRGMTSGVVWALPGWVWRLETTIRVEPRIIKHNIEFVVSQRTARGIEIEIGNRIRDPVDGLAILCVESQQVVAERERRSLELLNYIRIVKDE
jgi:hypothetical protein